MGALLHKRKNQGGYKMKSFWRSFFASLLAMIAIAVLIVGLFVIKARPKPKIKNHSYLVVDIYGDILEYDPPAGLMGQIVGGSPETLHRILENFEKARRDDRMDGVILKLSSSHSAGMAKLEEIRTAIKKVQDVGKKVYGFSDTMDRKTYLLAAACDSIFMPPSAYLSFLGFSATTQHVKGTLEKLGINANVSQIKEYKSAAEMVTRSNMSPASRRNKEWLLQETWDMFTKILEQDRQLSEKKIIELMDHAVFTAEEAKESGLIDRIFYWDELENRLKQTKDQKLRTVSQDRYAMEDLGKFGLKGKKKIAVIHAQGLIWGRRSKVDPVFGIMVGHETVAASFRRACTDDGIAAVVFRVDSPGGDGLTSDLIGHEVEKTAQEKPVVVSMLDVAASGGYEISYRASKIVADPMTITGSIGSIGGKYNIKGLLNKLGITYDFATKGPMALMYSDYHDFTTKEWDRYKINHWAHYNTWLKDVASHRGMTIEQAENLAQGRVWTGRQAKENGLIDDLGGLDRAVEIAKELANIPKEEKVTLLHYPEKKGLIGLFLGKGGNPTAAMRWILYRFLREDLAETWQMINESLALINKTEVE